eukprot:11994490-Alexandrium_andersonii.AAC.1
MCIRDRNPDPPLHVLLRRLVMVRRCLLSGAAAGDLQRDLDIYIERGTPGTCTSEGLQQPPPFSGPPGTPAPHAWLPE